MCLVLCFFHCGDIGGSMLHVCRNMLYSHESLTLLRKQSKKICFSCLNQNNGCASAFLLSALFLHDFSSLECLPCGCLTAETVHYRASCHEQVWARLESQGLRATEYLPLCLCLCVCLSECVCLCPTLWERWKVDPTYQEFFSREKQLVWTWWGVVYLLKYWNLDMRQGLRGVGRCGAPQKDNCEGGKGGRRGEQHREEYERWQEK